MHMNKSIVCLSVCLSFCLSAGLSICLSASLPACQLVSPSVSPSICVSLIFILSLLLSLFLIFSLSLFLSLLFLQCSVPVCTLISLSPGHLSLPLISDPLWGLIVHHGFLLQDQKWVISIFRFKNFFLLIC